MTRGETGDGIVEVDSVRCRVGGRVLEFSWRFELCFVYT